MKEYLTVQLAMPATPENPPEDMPDVEKPPAPRRRDVLFYSGATVDRQDKNSGAAWQLRFDMDSADLSGFAEEKNAPVLDNHQTEEISNVLGRVISATRRPDGFHAQLLFSNREDVDGVWQDIEDGILRNVSMGVEIGELVLESRPGSQIRQFVARNWKPYEISVVPIGADPNAKILSTSLTAAPGADQQRAQYELALRMRRWRVLGK